MATPSNMTPEEIAVLTRRVCRAIQGVLPDGIAFAVVIAETHRGGLLNYAGNAQPEATAWLLRHMQAGIERGEVAVSELPEPS